MSIHLIQQSQEPLRFNTINNTAHSQTKKNPPAYAQSVCKFLRSRVHDIQVMRQKAIATFNSENPLDRLAAGAALSSFSFLSACALCGIAAMYIKLRSKIDTEPPPLCEEICSQVLLRLEPSSSRTKQWQITHLSGDNRETRFSKIFSIPALLPHQATVSSCATRDTKVLPLAPIECNIALFDSGIEAINRLNNVKLHKGDQSSRVSYVARSGIPIVGTLTYSPAQIPVRPNDHQSSSKPAPQHPVPNNNKENTAQQSPEIGEVTFYIRK